MKRASGPAIEQVIHRRPLHRYPLCHESPGHGSPPTGIADDPDEQDLQQWSTALARATLDQVVKMVTPKRETGMSGTEPRAPFTAAQRSLGPSSSPGDGTSGSLDTPQAQRRPTRVDLPLLVGLAAVAFTAVYLISDLIEVAQGGFSTFRLFLTYVGEAAIPLFVIGLYAVQRPRIGRLGFLGAIAYAYSYVFFTSTVVYALISATPNYKALVKVFGAWMTVHGLILLIGGLAFGLATVRAGVLPRWTGVCLMAGVVLVVAASGLSDVARTIAAAVPAIAFIGMGIALLRSVIRSAPDPSHGSGPASHPG